MAKSINWGVLGTAKIAIEKVIPALQTDNEDAVLAIASRDLVRAQETSVRLGIKTAYGSYEELLQNEAIDAVYIPLPNSHHLEWIVKTAQAGKHVLCEKPICLNSSEAEKLLATQKETGVFIQEAFMVRTHPMWLKTRELILSGEIGELMSITGFFSYHNTDPANIRNRPELGGGSLYDIGCYCVNLSRWIFEAEPEKVNASIRENSEFGTDEMTSAILEFEKGHATFTCSTRLLQHQRMNFIGTKGRIEVKIPFNIPRMIPTSISLDKAGKRSGDDLAEIVFDTEDQYRTQAKQFSETVLGQNWNGSQLLDSARNTAVLDAVFESAKTERSVSPKCFD